MSITALYKLRNSQNPVVKKNLQKIKDLDEITIDSRLYVSIKRSVELKFQAGAKQKTQLLKNLGELRQSLEQKESEIQTFKHSLEHKNSEIQTLIQSLELLNKEVATLKHDEKSQNLNLESVKAQITLLPRTYFTYQELENYLGEIFWNNMKPPSTLKNKISSSITTRKTTKRSEDTKSSTDDGKTAISRNSTRKNLTFKKHSKQKGGKSGSETAKTGVSKKNQTRKKIKFQ